MLSFWYQQALALVEEIDEQLRTRDELLDELKRHLAAASNRMKQFSDRKRRDVEFQVDDWVFLRLQPYRQRSVFNRSSQKLSNRFYGPFRVVARVGQVAYRLQLPAGSRIHPVFHVSLLKKWVGEDVPVSVELPPIRENGYLSLELEQVVATRRVLQGNKTVTEVLIHWQHLPLEEATWEDLEQITTSFPNFDLNLEDKVLLDHGSIDRMQDEHGCNYGNEAKVARRMSSRTRRPNQKYLV